jgi:EAL domain-containing protein (putative c-di-GMP-specific phosphodiesterase class I)/GGDEF domain-containing protein
MYTEYRRSFMNHLEELDRIITTENITTVFQPIVCLKDGNVIGYEALTRGPEDSPLKFPDKLFEAAELHNKLWDLECLCRSKAIERAREIDKDKLLFINVDPNILEDEKYRQGFTKEFLSKFNMSPESIIFEITERTSIKDYKKFRNVLNNYLGEGYKIAIDDTGAGYAGLKMLVETRPHYVKIDMEIVRNVHKDSFKETLIRCLVNLAENANMKLIAEGIETFEELIKLIELGVYAGQGYYLQRPAVNLLDIPQNIKDIIVKYKKEAENKFSPYSKNYIGDIARKDLCFDLNMSCRDIKYYLDSTGRSGACIVQDNEPVGLIMKHSLDSVLATQYGIAVFSRRPVSLVMNHKPLIVDYYTPVSEVSTAAMSRDDNNIYDYVIVTKNAKYYGIVTVKKLLEFTTTLERNYAKELNPLTGLPGNTIIEKTLQDILEYDYDTCVLYFDLDNFKVYNDTYGFENGDKVILFTANMITRKIKDFFPLNNFIGHIGGDDFMCVVEGSIDKCHELCNSLISDFDKGVLNFFNERDRSCGYVEAVDRKGITDVFDLTSITMAGVYGNLKDFNKNDDISKYIFQVKKKAKEIRHSSFIINDIRNANTP